MFVYDCYNCNLIEQPTSITLNLRKDGCTNWTTCKNCNMYVQYRHFDENGISNKRKLKKIKRCD